MPRAAIFDMDGLMVDSEPLWTMAEIDVFGAIGVPLTRERCFETRGLRIDEVVAYWYERYRWTIASADVVQARVLESVAALIRLRAEPMPGALEAIAHARKRCEKLAVASSSPRRLIEAVLEKFNIGSQFDMIHSAEDEEHGKPHPAVYLTTARALGVPPAACVAFEDSFHGVLAAKAARMKCVAVPDRAQQNDPRWAIADVVVASLEKFDDVCWARLD